MTTMTFNIFKGCKTLNDKGDFIDFSLINENFKDTNYGTDLLPKDSIGNVFNEKINLGDNVTRWLNTYISDNIDVKMGDSLGTRLTGVLAYFENNNDVVLNFLTPTGSKINFTISTPSDDKVLELEFNESISKDNGYTIVKRIDSGNTTIFHHSVSEKSFIYSKDANIFDTSPTDGAYIEFSITEAEFTDLINPNADGKRSSSAIICAFIDSINGNSEVELNNGDESGYFFRARGKTETKSFVIRSTDINDEYSLGFLTGENTFSDDLKISPLKIVATNNLEFTQNLKMSSGGSEINELIDILSGFTITIRGNSDEQVRLISSGERIRPILLLRNDDITSEAYLKIKGEDSTNSFKRIFVKGVNAQGQYIESLDDIDVLDTDDIRLDTQRPSYFLKYLDFETDTNLTDLFTEFTGAPLCYEISIGSFWKEVTAPNIKQTQNLKLYCKLFVCRQKDGFYDIDVVEASWVSNTINNLNQLQINNSASQTEIQIRFNDGGNVFVKFFINRNTGELTAEQVSNNIVRWNFEEAKTNIEVENIFYID